MKLPEAVQDKLIDVGEMVLRKGSLAPEVKALVALCAAVACHCTHCHGEFRKMARSLGRTDQEIEEAVKIAMRMRERCANETAFYKMAP